MFFGENLVKLGTVLWLEGKKSTPTNSDGAFEALFCLLLKDIKGLFVTFYVKKVILFNSAPLSKHDTQLPKKGLEGR